VSGSDEGSMLKVAWCPFVWQGGKEAMLYWHDGGMEYSTDAPEIRNRTVSNETMAGSNCWSEERTEEGEGEGEVEGEGARRISPRRWFSYPAKQTVI
jgi:hypothetical protein